MGYSENLARTFELRGGTRSGISQPLWFLSGVLALSFLVAVQMAVNPHRLVMRDHKELGAWIWTQDTGHAMLTTETLPDLNAHHTKAHTDTVVACLSRLTYA